MSDLSVLLGVVVFYTVPSNTGALGFTLSAISAGSGSRSAGSVWGLLRLTPTMERC